MEFSPNNITRGNEDMKTGTRVIRAWLPEPEQGKPFSEGVWFASAYHAAGESASSPYPYGRYHNPKQ